MGFNLLLNLTWYYVINMFRSPWNHFDLLKESTVVLEKFYPLTDMDSRIVQWVSSVSLGPHESKLWNSKNYTADEFWFNQGVQTILSGLFLFGLYSLIWRG